jgi:hypothetical protein
VFFFLVFIVIVFIILIIVFIIVLIVIIVIGLGSTTRLLIEKIILYEYKNIVHSFTKTIVF